MEWNKRNTAIIIGIAFALTHISGIAQTISNFIVFTVFMYALFAVSEKVISKLRGKSAKS